MKLDGEYLSVIEIGDILNLSYKTVYRWIEKSNIPIVKVGKTRIVSIEGFEKLKQIIAKREIPPLNIKEKRNEIPNSPKYLTKRDLGKVIGFSHETIAKWFRRYSLPCVKIGQRIMIKKEDLEELITIIYQMEGEIQKKSYHKNRENVMKRLRAAYKRVTETDMFPENPDDKKYPTEEVPEAKEEVLKSEFKERTDKLIKSQLKGEDDKSLTQIDPYEIMLSNDNSNKNKCSYKVGDTVAPNLSLPANESLIQYMKINNIKYFHVYKIQKAYHTYCDNQEECFILREIPYLLNWYGEIKSYNGPLFPANRFVKYHVNPVEKHEEKTPRDLYTYPEIVKILLDNPNKIYRVGLNKPRWFYGDAYTILKRAKTIEESERIFSLISEPEKKCLEDTEEE